VGLGTRPVQTQVFLTILLFIYFMAYVCNVCNMYVFSSPCYVPYRTVHIESLYLSVLCTVVHPQFSTFSLVYHLTLYSKSEGLLIRYMI
jgi:hypothetical protein